MEDLPDSALPLHTEAVHRQRVLLGGGGLFPVSDHYRLLNTLGEGRRAFRRPDASTPGWTCEILDLQSLGKEVPTDDVMMLVFSVVISGHFPSAAT